MLGKKKNQIRFLKKISISFFELKRNSAPDLRQFGKLEEK
jgi:hypothetical protein